MASQMLQKARAYEKERGAQIRPRERPGFHLTGETGWINDPNGFSFYKGAYHLFYQSNPYDTHWGAIHWGHAKSADLVRWEYVGAALAPDMPYDGAGCFSGSALELPDGRHLIMYTGVQDVRREDGSLRGLQTQCVAFGDGVDYEKFQGNPVLAAGDLPEGASPWDFRDPKLWREPDGTYRMVAANDRGDGRGQVLLFESPDTIHWKYLSVLAQSRGELGQMWECPDYFRLGGKRVLTLSVMGMEPRGLEFHPGHNTAVLIAGEGEAFSAEGARSLDYGLDFYAPQTMETPDGRRILVAWMQNWAASGFAPPEARYFGQLTLPRELECREGRLLQKPVRELERYRARPVVYANVPLGEETGLEGIRGVMLDLTVRLRWEEGCGSIRIALRKGGVHETTLTLFPGQGILRLDRSRSGCLLDVVHTRDIPVDTGKGTLELRLILDRFSLELFCDGGKQCASALLTTPEQEDGISFYAQGPAWADVEKYDLDVR